MLTYKLCQNILKEFDSINDFNPDQNVGGKSTLRSPCTEIYNDCFSDHTYSLKNAADILHIMSLN